MKYEHIRQEAYDANMQLPKLGLVLFTFGNVSAVDRSLAVFAIKPSGVAYEELNPAKMVIVDFEGNVVEGSLRPSSDTKTHGVLYKHWDAIGGIVHTHSTYATAWAQSQLDIPIYGTTHADYNTVDIPCAAPMSDEMIKGNYEQETLSPLRSGAARVCPARLGGRQAGRLGVGKTRHQGGAPMLHLSRHHLL